MMDLTGEVSSGAVDMAKSNLEKMLVSWLTIDDWKQIVKQIFLCFK